MNKKAARKEQGEWVKRLENEVRDLVAKLEFMAGRIETAEGRFVWPDGSWIQTRRRIVLRSLLPLPVEPSAEKTEKNDDIGEVKSDLS